jgi:hypothetical protein
MDSATPQTWLVRRATIAGVALVAAVAAPSCGSNVVGDCSMGAPGCPGGLTVHWTATRISAAANHFSYAPMVRGRLRKTSCHITTRHSPLGVSAICSATFTAPRKPPRRIRVMLAFSENGAVNIQCPRRIADNPFCRWDQAHP